MADVHFTLPAELLAELDQVAKERNIRRSELLRNAIRDCLGSDSKGSYDPEMAEYVDALAEYSAEFVSERATEVDDQTSGSGPAGYR